LQHNLSIVVRSRCKAPTVRDAGDLFMQNESIDGRKREKDGSKAAHHGGHYSVRVAEGV
jgi:hypothetical protein